MTFASRQIPRERPLIGAFSLVEVVLALGIGAFALVGILSLVSVALNTSRESRQDTDSGMLFKQVVSQLRVKPFTNVQAGAGGTNAAYPLPALNVAGSKTEFFVDSRNEFIGDVSGPLPTDARAVVTVAVLDAQDLGVKDMNAPPPASGTSLAFVRVAISSAAAFLAGQTNAADAYVTEIVSLER